MTEGFANFAQQHIVSLDALLKDYIEYRIDLTQSYWAKLRLLIRDNLPSGYTFEGTNRELITDSLGERVCGWTRDFEGSQITIGFAVYQSASDLAHGRWPFMKNTCWTGIKGLNRDLKKSVLDLASPVEPEEAGWQVWRSWEPLSEIGDVTELHRVFQGEEAQTGQREIVEQLHWWHDILQKVLVLPS